MHSGILLIKPLLRRTLLLVRQGRSTCPAPLTTVYRTHTHLEEGASQISWQGPNAEGVFVLPCGGSRGFGRLG